MNDLILYVISGIAVVCLFVMIYFELKAGYTLRKALKGTLSFGARRILLGFGIALFLIALYKLVDWLWEALL